MQAREVIAALVSAGYAPGIHEGVIGPAIDKSRMAEISCPFCEHQGLTFAPFIKPGGYRVAAVCPSCGAASERW